MSRNLCATDCDRCSGEVVIVGPVAPITKEQAGVYFDEYEGMLVADAECTVCLARYLAWVDERPRVNKAHSIYHRGPTERGFSDLSYRAAFNDEPADEDVPPWTKPAALRSQVATLQAERDAARRERDEARAEMAVLEKIVAAEREQRDATEAERDRLKAALEAIARGDDEDRAQYRIVRMTTAEAIAMLTASLPRSVQGEPPRCEPWCGGHAGELPYDGVRWSPYGQGFCSTACLDAGHPVNPMCETGCGGRAGEVPDGEWFMRGTGDGICFCTPACRDAGRPLHPRKGEQGRCGTCGGSGIDDSLDAVGLDSPENHCWDCKGSGRGTRPPQETTTKETP